MPLTFNHKIILEKIVLIVSSLKWAWDFLLHQSFFQSSCSDLDVLAEVDSYSLRRDSDTIAECSVCLCKIEEGDEIRELKCSHIFHSVCFDRWIGYGHWTCPLCRNNLKFSRFDDDAGEVIHQQVLVFNFCQARTRNNETWWLR